MVAETQAPPPQSQLEDSLVAPHSQDAEQALLGSVIINPDTFHDVVSFLTAEDFFNLRHRYIWEAMVRLDGRENSMIEYLSLIEELRAHGQLQQVGGAAYITLLTSKTATAMHAETYGQIVLRTAIRRRMIEAANEIAEIARAEQYDINQAIDYAETALLSVTQRSDKRILLPVKDASQDYFIQAEFLYNNPDVDRGLMTGFHDIDQLLETGIDKTEFFTLAARPGMGKTALLLNMFRNMSKNGKKIAFFSIEMNNAQLMDRLMAMFTDIPHSVVKSKRFTEEQWKIFQQAREQFQELPAFISDESSVNPLVIKRELRRIIRQHGPIDGFMVDYLQLMEGNGKEKRHEEVADIVRGIRSVIDDFQIPAIVAAQLNRSVESRSDKRPLLSDLAESGFIEQAAETVAFIYRDEVYNSETVHPNEAEIIFRKRRSGPTDTVNILFHKEKSQFVDLKRYTPNI